MPQPTLTGLCVGGPLDGQMLSYPGERYKVLTPREPVVSYAAPARDATCEVLEYRHWAMSYGPFPTDFWLPVGKDPAWAFRHVLESYTRMIVTEESNPELFDPRYIGRGHG